MDGGTGRESKLAIPEAAGKLSAQALEAAKGAAALLSMNNIFYRFQHLVENGGSFLLLM